MAKERIPVVWGLDEKYVLQAFVVMHSILKNSDRFYDFYIITADDIAEEVEEYSRLLQGRSEHFRISVKIVGRTLFSNARIHNQHLSIAAFFRLLIPDLLTGYDKCIYLDCDLLVNGDLAELFDIDLSDDYLAGVKDCHIIADDPIEWEHEKILGIPSRDRYVNSGVLLLHLRKMRDDGMVARFMSQMERENWYEDQDVLNVCCYPHIKILPLRYNLFHFYYGKSRCFLYHLNYKKEEFVFEKPFIVHMGGGDGKPWNNKKVKCAEQWWELAGVFRDTKAYQRLERQKDCDETMLALLQQSRNRKIIIWGCSRNGEMLYDLLQAKGYTNIVAIVDNDDKKWGQAYCGVPVIAPDEALKESDKVFWIISNQASFEMVKQQLLHSGIEEGLIARYVDHYHKYSLLTLDEQYYDAEIEKIAEIEYHRKFSRQEERVRYLLQILREPEVFKGEYEYLNGRYNFKYWYHIKP